jgi:hypothetical protein
MAKEHGYTWRTEQGQIEYDDAGGAKVSDINARLTAVELGGGGGTPITLAQNLNTPNAVDIASTQAISDSIAASLSGITHNPIVQAFATPNTTDTPSTQAVADAIAAALTGAAGHPLVQDFTAPNNSDVASTTAVNAAINAAVTAVVHNPIVQNLTSPNTTDSASTQAITDAINAAVLGAGGNPIVQNLSTPNATDTASTQAVADAIAAGLTSVAHNPIVQNLVASNATDTPSTQAVSDAIAAAIATALATVVHHPIVQDLTAPNATDIPSTQAVADALAAITHRGQSLGEANTYAALPAAPDATATAIFTAALLVDDIGTGTADNPQYKKGVYNNIGAGYVFSFPIGSENEQSFLIDRITTVDTTITATEVLAEDGHFGIASTAYDGIRTLTLEAGITEPVEILIVAEQGNNSTIVVPPAGETINGDATGIEINFNGTVLLKKTGTDWVSTTIAITKLHDGSQPALAEQGITYDYFLMTTEQLIGQNADISLTTATNPPIFSVNGVETKTNSYSLPGTGTAQDIIVWVPIAEGQQLTANNAVITAIDARSSDVGIHTVSIPGLNNHIDDRVGFGTLITLQAPDQASGFTDQLALNSPLLENLIAYNSASAITDQFFVNAQNMKQVFLANTGSSLTNIATQNGLITVFSISNTQSPSIDGQAVTNAPLLTRFDAGGLNLTAAQVDSLLIALSTNTTLAGVDIAGTNQPRTSASDAAFAILDALLGTNLKVN